MYGDEEISKFPVKGLLLFVIFNGWLIPVPDVPGIPYYPVGPVNPYIPYGPVGPV